MGTGALASSGAGRDPRRDCRVHWPVALDIDPTAAPRGRLDLLPGAMAVGIAVGILQVVAAYLLGPNALQKQGTYGALGLAAAVLLSLWVLSCLLVGGAEIKATLWERKRRESK
jgi:uncharacterized BrkB/YihY/UPF0761 family membrane protein